MFFSLKKNNTILNFDYLVIALQDGGITHENSIIITCKYDGFRPFSLSCHRLQDGGVTNQYSM